MRVIELKSDTFGCVSQYRPLKCSESKYKYLERTEKVSLIMKKRLEFPFKCSGRQNPPQLTVRNFNIRSVSWRSSRERTQNLRPWQTQESRNVANFPLSEMFVAPGALLELLYSAPLRRPCGSDARLPGRRHQRLRILSILLHVRIKVQFAWRL